MATVGTDLVYELIINGDNLGIPFSNTFYYFNDDATPSDPASEELATEFGSVVLGQILALVNDDLEFTETVVRRLNNIDDFYTATYSVNGTFAGDQAASFVAYHLPRIRTTKESRSGWINIAGVSESDTNPGGNGLSAACQVRMQNVVDVLNLTLTPTVNTFKPVLVGNKRNYAVTPSTLKPESQWTYQLISTWAFSTKVSPQVSRKVR